MLAKTMSETSEKGYKEMQFHYKSDTRKEKQTTTMIKHRKDNVLSSLLIDVLIAMIIALRMTTKITMTVMEHLVILPETI